MSTQMELGKIVTTDPGRDAIHVAVVPVTAGHIVRPGEHCGWMDDDRVTVGRVPDTFGIVDPFLDTVVLPGQKFWLFLYPNTVTGMRHEWTHPSFPTNPAAASAPAVPVNVLSSTSVSWLTKFATNFDMSYDELMSAAKAYLTSGDCLVQQGNDDWRDTFSTHEDEFWRHYEAVVGGPVNDKGSFFSCSC